MKGMVAFFKTLEVRKFLLVFVAGVALLLSTACSNENLQSSRQNRPNDVPVQSTANNNPYTMGADSKGESVSTVNQVKQSYKDQHSDASPLDLSRLIASSVKQPDVTGILYQGNNKDTNNRSDARSDQSRAYQSEQIPARPQPSINRTNPNERILENIGEQFEQASEFLNDDTRSAVQQGKSKTVPSRSGETR